MQIINVDKVKKEIYNNVSNYYVNTSHIQLYSFLATDNTKFGFIFLLNCDWDNVYIYYECLNFLREQIRSKAYDIKAKFSELDENGKYIIKRFDGEMPNIPDKYTYDSCPMSEFRNMHSLIDYVAAGYAKSFDMNPNLISSLGYSFIYNANNKR